MKARLDALAWRLFEAAPIVFVALAIVLLELFFGGAK